MNDDRRYELISAYLDGELTPDEQSQAERLLSDDAAARRLYDELRALGAALRALPRHRLGDDFSEKVLRGAERTMLTRPTARGAPSADGRQRALGMPFGRSARGWAWAAMAIAAALLLMVFNPQDDVPVARQAPESAEAPREPQADQLTRSEPDAEMSSLPAPGESMRGPEEAESLADGPESAREPRANGRRSEALRGGARPSKMAAQDAADSDLAAGAVDQPASASRASQQAMEAAAAAPTELNEQMAQLAEEGVLVVQVDISREAAENNAMAALLTNQSIAWNEESLAGADAAPSAEPAPGKAGQSAQKFAPLAKDRAEADRDRAAEAESLQMVYVEAPAESIEAALADLAARPADFPAIEVEPAPGALRQQSLSAYGRNLVQQSQREDELEPKKTPDRARKLKPLSEPKRDALAEQSQGQLQSLPVGRAQRVRSYDELQQNRAAYSQTPADAVAKSGELATKPAAPTPPAPAKAGRFTPRKGGGFGQAVETEQMQVLFLLRVLPTEPDAAAEEAME